MFVVTALDESITSIIGPLRAPASADDSHVLGRQESRSGIASAGMWMETLPLA